MPANPPGPSHQHSFDPHFNAITGLNGSGKSNILDSICFVLGITNLSQVRAGNLSELVYKQGQAGEAVALLQQAQDVAADDRGVAYAAILALQLDGRFAEAMELMYTGGHTGKLLVNVAAATGSA